MEILQFEFVVPSPILAKSLPTSKTNQGVGGEEEDGLPVLISSVVAASFDLGSAGLSRGSMQISRKSLATVGQKQCKSSRDAKNELMEGKKGQSWSSSNLHFKSKAYWHSSIFEFRSRLEEHPYLH